ncbi:hypothetical protein CFC35_16555 [Streptomyces sp. FBKL.4005]|uniref:hypothetical protein n=1 Tax=Streptomyces sp. FBKL.4005 TaxID=2015515 RepID=UPI000B96E9A3|nr:hypothetical protein [Streptomyces sp. FBKL.4005]OYP20167.1 hypothetical protein CFC35_16555 [Streptomyces sp. FBKL.4005]
MSAPQEPPPERSPLSTFAEKAAYIAAPGTVALGLLYYFGSVYIREYYSALGVVPEDLGMSVQNVMASSTQAVFLPLCLLLAGGLVVFLLVGLLGRALARPRLAEHRRTAIILLLAVGMAMVFVDFPALFSDLAIPFPAGLPKVFLPALLVAVGATLGLCAVHLRLNQSTDLGGAPRSAENDRVWLAVGALLIGMLTISLFFDMAQYAAVIGRSNATHDARRGFRGKPTVVVHSRVLLTHNARDVEFKDHGSGSGPYRYEYRGFQLLAKAPARFYLVSHTARYRDAVVVLPDDGTAWLEIRAPKP